MLTDTYIRFTFPDEISEQHVKMLTLSVENLTSNYLKEDTEIIYYTTEEGHSYEVPLSKDLNEKTVEAIETVLSPHFNELTIEASGE